MNITHWLVSVLAIVVASFLIPGVHVTLVGAIIFAVVWALINVFVKPIVTILTLPITIVTLGIFSLVVNALFILLASRYVPGFVIPGFWSAFFFSILLSLINALFGVKYR